MKKTAASKRAALPRAADYTKSFLKDWERLSRSGRYDMNRLKEAMLKLIANDGPLGAEWLDHPLKGNWEGHRECHIGGDFLLVYKLDDQGKVALVVFVAAGTHAEVGPIVKSIFYRGRGSDRKFIAACGKNLRAIQRYGIVQIVLYWANTLAGTAFGRLLPVCLTLVDIWKTSLKVEFAVSICRVTLPFCLFFFRWGV